MAENSQPFNVLETLKSSEMRNAIIPLIKQHVTPERFFAMAASSAKAFLKKKNVSPESILMAIYQAAKLGLEPDDALGHAYLVPFWSTQYQKTFATLIPGYRGLIHLARKSGKVHDIKSWIIFEKDDFDYVIEDGKTRMTFRPNLTIEDRGKKIAILTVVYWEDDSHDPRIDIMPYAKVDRIGKAQIIKTKNKGPWTTHRDEMDLKTATRYTCKTLPLTPELSKAISFDEGLEMGKLDGEIPLALENIVSDEYKQEMETLSEKPESASTKPNVEKPTAKNKSAGRSVESKKPEEKSDEKPKFAQKMNVDVYKKVVAPVLDKLHAQGLTDDEIGQLLVKAGYNFDPLEQEERDRTKALQLLMGYVENSNA